MNSQYCSAKPDTFCLVSTGICKRLTFGSGRLSPNGYWEIPCDHCACLAEARDSKLVGTYWPPVEKPETHLQFALREVFEALNELERNLRPFSPELKGIGVKPLEEQSTSEKIKFAKLVLAIQGLELPHVENDRKKKS